MAARRRRDREGRLAAISGVAFLLLLASSYLWLLGLKPRATEALGGPPAATTWTIRRCYT
jgi:hypothetical protein